jgi:hypothetical protein
MLFREHAADLLKMSLMAVVKTFSWFAVAYFSPLQKNNIKFKMPLFYRLIFYI